MPCLWQTPAFVKKARVGNIAGSEVVWRGGEVDNGPVRKFWSLESVGGVGSMPEGKSAVEDDIALWSERVGIHKHRGVGGCGVGALAKFEDFFVPLDGKLVLRFFTASE